MTGKVFITLAVLIAVAGCARISESRLNPFNWFGRSQQVAVVTAAPGQPSYDLVAQIITLRVEPAPGGAIIRATGLPPQQGYYDGVLVPVAPETAEQGVLTYHFAISAPPGPTRVSTPQSREVVIGLFVSEQRLAGIRQIRVSAAGNALAVRR